MSETRDFLAALFGTMPEGARILIWTLPEKRSFFCSSVDEAVETVERVRSSSDVYYGISLAPKDYGYNKRCPASEALAIPGVWADFDIAHSEAHKKPNLPANREDVLTLLKDAGLPPTISVNSGHGLQCYWLFDELWQLRSEADRGAAETLARRWNYTLRTLAKRRGWDVDATWDLARVYRVPGTTNRKVKSDPAPVTIIEQTERTYSQADILNNLVGDDPLPENGRGKTTSQGTVQAEDLNLDPAASVDIELFDLLREADPKFESSWLRKRRDFQDQSGSSYDMSLATIAAQAGWEDQAIVNLLIAHRRKHGDDLKLRLDYYRMTLRKARESLAKVVAVERLQEILATVEEHIPVDVDLDNRDPETPKPVSPEHKERRSSILRHASDLLGFEIVRIIKYVSSEPTYRLETARGGIMLGGVTGLIKQDALRNQVAALTGFYIPKFKPQLWDTMAQCLLNAVEEQSAGEEATDEGAIRTWLRIYLSENLPSEGGLSEDVVANQTPYKGEENGRIYIFGVGIQDWLKKKYGENLGHKRLGALLRLHGAVPEVVGCTVNTKKTTRSVWRLPYDDAEGEF